MRAAESLLHGLTAAHLLVTKCRPKLDLEEVARAVDKLNESREFSPFLKDMRQLFKKAAVGE